MIELVQITAQYSNAVLVAILPYVSDFAQRLNLPTAAPVMPAQVLSFRCDPRKGEIGGLITLTNAGAFAFLEGRICSYRSPKSYFSLQDPELIPKFFGPVRVKEKEARETACGVIEKLGYTADMFRADLKPKVTMPERMGSNYIARYRFQWLDPAWQRNKPITGVVPALLDVEVDASTGQIQMVSIASLASRRPSPKVDVVPPLMNVAQPERHQQLVGGMKTLPVSAAYSVAFLNAILPQLSDFAVKVRLSLSLPITTNDIDLAHYHCRMLAGLPIAQVVLKNGDRFNYEHGHITAFYAHDAYRKFPENGRLEDFSGKANMTTNEAIALCEHAIKDLGYTAKLPKAVLGTVTRLGGKEITRYVFYWWKKGENAEFASFEVDMESKAIKSVYLDDASLWRDAPKIDVPPTPETNGAAANPIK